MNACVNLRAALAFLAISGWVVACTSEALETSDIAIEDLGMTAEITVNTEDFSAFATARARSSLAAGDNDGPNFFDTSTGQVRLSNSDSFVVVADSDTTTLTPEPARFSTSGDFTVGSNRAMSLQFRRGGNPRAQLNLDLSTLNPMALTLTTNNVSIDEDIIGEIVFTNELVDRPANPTQAAWRIAESRCQNGFGETVTLPATTSVGGFPVTAMFESGRLQIVLRAAQIVSLSGVDHEEGFGSFSSCEFDLVVIAKRFMANETIGNLGFGAIATQEFSNSIRASFNIESSSQVVTVNFSQ